MTYRRVVLLAVVLLVAGGLGWVIGRAAPAQPNAGASRAAPAATSSGTASCPVTEHSTLGAVTTAVAGIKDLADAFLVGTDYNAQLLKRRKVLERYVADNLRATYAQLFQSTLIPATLIVDVPALYSVTTESADTVAVSILLAGFVSDTTGVKQQAGFVDLTLRWNAAVGVWQIAALKNRVLTDAKDLASALSTGKEFCHVPTSG